MAQQKSQTFSVKYLTKDLNEHNLQRNSVIFAMPLKFIFQVGGQPTTCIWCPLHMEVCDYIHILIIFQSMTREEDQALVH